MKWTFGLLAFVMIVSLAFAGLPLASRQLAQAPTNGERLLETPNWVISVRPVGHYKLYSVYSRNGHPLPLGLSDAQIAVRYPDLYRGLRAPLSAYHPLVEAATGTEHGITAASILH